MLILLKKTFPQIIFELCQNVTIFVLIFYIMFMLFSNTYSSCIKLT